MGPQVDVGYLLQSAGHAKQQVVISIGDPAEGTITRPVGSSGGYTHRN